MKRKTDKKLQEKLGKPPGTLVFTGISSGAESEYTLIRYSDDGDETYVGKELEEILPHVKPGKVNWINIDAIHNVERVEKLGRHFGMHSLVLEDVLNTLHPPKMEDFEDYIFMAVKMMQVDKEKDEIMQEHMSFVLFEDKLISFQERSGDVFGPIRERIANPLSKVRQRKADYLLYYLVDLLVDNYYLVVEHYSEEVDDLEDEILHDPDHRTVLKINGLKRKLSGLKRSFFQVREALRELKRTESSLLEDYVHTYFNDVSEHLSQLITNTEVMIETLQGLMEMYMTIISNKMNRVMYTLTIVATIFIPLTFLAGIYGMNFSWMPELEWKYSYPVLLLVMLGLGIGMYLFMKKKRWF